jgi:AAA15 family ATPase/GTPase
MLKSLRIENFKNIKKIHIPSLATVNLITGKNNTSKTSLLESISLLSSNIDFNLMFQLIAERGELFYSANENGMVRSIDNLKSLSSLFYGRQADTEEQSPIFIGDEGENISLRFVNYIEEVVEDINQTTGEKSIIGRRRSKVVVNNGFNDSLIGLEIQTKNYNTIVPIDDSRSLSNIRTHLPIQKRNFQFIKPSYQENEMNGILWDKIALTEKEDLVINTLRIIEEDLEKISFIKEESSSRERRVIAKIRNVTERIPLKSMGDGINRVLAIILGLVNADNGYLLIDEFENGLHYSVQEKLWETVFNLSQKLKIQVFATTHSNDCISAFSKVTNADEYKNLGKLIKLEKVNTEIKAVDFNSNELNIAENQNIELR